MNGYKIAPRKFLAGLAGGRGSGTHALGITSQAVLLDHFLHDFERGRVRVRQAERLSDALLVGIGDVLGQVDIDAAQDGLA